ncbi:MAG: phage protease [Desulfobulbaceae bacterium]|nr:phage protease [Desulfobulbaceae bacterium]
MNSVDEKLPKACNSFELPGDGSVPEWVELLPSGQIIVGRDKRRWINDNPQDVVTAFATNRAAVPVDIEHATEKKGPIGEAAPAMGWIEEMEVREGGAVWGRVEWTTKGKELIANREYRYFSPVFKYEPRTTRVRIITSVGLTNSPNLYLTALNQQQHEEEPNMDLKQLLAACGLPETTTFAQALNHINKMTGDLATATNRAENPSLEKFVPRADHDAALARATNAEQKLKELNDTQLEKEIETEVGDALKAGKITPATTDYHKAQCRQEGGLDRFRDFVKAAPVVGDASGLDGKQPERDGKALNSEEKKVCENLGISEEEYQKAM